MATLCPLELTRAQRAVLGGIADNYRYFRDARRDNARDRALSEARYFIYGATGLDCQDDAELARVLMDIWEDRPCEEIRI